MEWINRPVRLASDAVLEYSEQVADSTETKKSIAAFIRADFLELLHKGETIDAAHATLWAQYVAAYKLRSVKKPKTRDERADKTRYSTFYNGLKRVRETFLPVTYGEYEVIGTLDVSTLWLDAEFNGSINFEIVLSNLASATARRNKIVTARIEQLENAARVEFQRAEKEKFDAAVKAATKKTK